MVPSNVFLSSKLLAKIIMNSWSLFYYRYDFIEYIVKGSSRSVLKAKDKQTGEVVAVKILKQGKAHVTPQVKNEIINHCLLQHPHVIAVRDVFLYGGHLCLAMEYAPGIVLHLSVPWHCWEA